MNTQNIKKAYILIAVATSLLLVVMISIFFLLQNRMSTSLSQNPTPTMFPTPKIKYDEQYKYHNHIDKPPPKPNPTYLQKIKDEPFWEMLPHWSNTYKIEYKDSADKIIITTINGTEAETNSYKESARNWLQTNGAKLNELSIEYQTVQ